MPLAANGTPVGAFNLYARQPHFFGEAETRLAAQVVLTEQLQASLASRSVIDQAIGIIMAEQRCTPADAFAILRSASQNRNIKLRRVAEDIVRTVSGQPPQPPPFNPS